MNMCQMTHIHKMKQRLCSDKHMLVLQFDPTEPCLEANIKYNHNPTLNDKVHCLVFVIPAKSFTAACNDNSNAGQNTRVLLHDSLIQKMEKIRRKACDLSEYTILQGCNTRIQGSLRSHAYSMITECKKCRKIVLDPCFKGFVLVEGRSLFDYIKCIRH